MGIQWESGSIWAIEIPVGKMISENGNVTMSGKLIDQNKCMIQLQNSQG